VLPPATTDQAIISAAEQFVREAQIGRSQLLFVTPHTPHTRRRAMIRSMKRGLFSRDQRLKLLGAIRSSPPSPPTWSVGFLLYDDRYTHGVTLATVTLDESAAVLKLDVHGGPNPTVT
jgi:hypothetical protein